MTVENVTMDLLAKALDAAYLNHQVIANNVANVDTQGYHVLKMQFDSAFENVRELLDSGASDSRVEQALKRVDLKGSVVPDETATRVALDQQMVELTKNSLRYEALIGARSVLDSIETEAIKGGRG